MNFKDKVKAMTSKEQMILLEKYVDLIEKKNKVMNLTGFSGDKLWAEGIYESIVVLNEVIGLQKGRLLDIGAGAGFPSIPFLIFNPKIKLTIYEPMLKRVAFLKTVRKELDLHISIKQARAETSKDKEVFDFITARAVVNFKALAEISHDLGKVGALFLFIKGPKATEEIKQAKKISDKLRIEPKIYKIKEIITKEINIIQYEKRFKTPLGFPREWGIIKKN